MSENIFPILIELSKTADELRESFTYCDLHPEDPHGLDDIDYRTEHVYRVIQEFRAWGKGAE